MQKGKPFSFGNMDCLTFDHAESPDVVLEALDRELKSRFGIELVQHETESDFVAVSLQKVA